MKTCSIKYTQETDLKNFLEINNITQSSEVLLQIFTGIIEQDYIENLISQIKKLLPNIKIIGATTAGEIKGFKTCQNTTVLSFTIFENTKIKTQILENKNNSFELGANLVNSFEKDDLENSKLLISFADGLSLNAQELLNGIHSQKEDIVIAGGLAADNYKFEKTFVFNEEKILQNGAIGALFINKDLNLFTNYNFNWQSISTKHIIEKSIGNRVYKIDGMSTIDFYKYYLGEQVCEKLPRAGIEFPLILEIDGIKVARVVFSKHDDGSMTFAADIPEGSIVRIGYGNIKNILHNTVEDINSLNNENIESLFIYSCSARRELLKKYVDYEIGAYSKIINEISGFYTYGEFFNKNLLNQTLTVLGISEKENKIVLDKKIELNNLEINENEYDFYKTQGLSHILSVATNELDSLNQNLEKRVQEELEKSRQKDALIEANSRHAQMGEMMDMIVHQYRQPLSALSIGLSSLEFCSKADLLDKDMFERTLTLLNESVAHLNNTIEDFRTFFNTSQKNELIKPSEIVSKLNNITKAIFKKLDIKLDIQLDFDELILINIGKVLQVLLNLVKNASDQLELNRVQNPKISIKIYRIDDICHFEVEDNAGGIKEEYLEKIFDKGFTTKSDSDGTGLGLDMSKTIALNHLDGDLLVKNSLEGAVFTLKVTIRQQ